MKNLDAHELTFPVRKNPRAASVDERAELLRDPPWGRVFTDHMFTLRYTRGCGWHDGEIGPHTHFSLQPGAMVLHYAQEVFEGMKAYRQPDGGTALFRPDANARRLKQSAERLAIPPLPENMFVESVRAFARVERDWISAAEGATLYLRPFIFSPEVLMGTKPSDEFVYSIIACPVGPNFMSSGSAVTVWVSEDYIRAAPGGTGAAKCGGNYAAGLPAYVQANQEGCQQVVFLDAIERRWIEEFGAMNAFFVFDDGSLLTPPLTGTILPGVTRDSLITLARDLGHVVHEEPYSIDQWQADASSGRLRETFACGTAAVVTPVGRVKGRRHNFVVGDGGAGPITEKLKAALTAIQFGRAPDPHHWRDPL